VVFRTYTPNINLLLACHLAGKFIKETEEIIDKTKEAQVEHAFKICRQYREEEDYTITESCSGTKCSVKPPECEKGIPVATVHTHPSGDYEPSVADIYYTLTRKEKVGCIGTPFDTIVTQYTEGEREKEVEVSTYFTKCYAVDTNHPKFQEFMSEFSKLYSIYAPLKRIITDRILRGEKAPEDAVKKLQDVKEKVRKLLDSAEKDKIYKECSPMDEAFERLYRLKSEEFLI